MSPVDEEVAPISQIAEFYSHTNVFVTGATGYLGKLFVEKLLRTCENITRVYVLVRPKKGEDEETRFKGMFSGPNFDPLRKQFPDFASKITLICGDCSLPCLGLSEEIQEKLISEVNCIVHCAATVRFDQKLKTAAYINVRAVRDLLEMAKKMKNLKSFLHVSTAFSNCPKRTEIKETFYPPPTSSEKLLTLVEIVPESKLDEMTPILLGDYPNTYIYTKCVAEDLIKNNGKELPICILRPSIVIASVKEPVAGWIDNFYGATGIVVGAALGVIRSLHGKRQNSADMVPADYAVNCGLACAWEVATSKLENEVEAVPVYNFVSYPEARITWAEFTQLAEKHGPNVPTTKQVWRYFFTIRSCVYWHRLAIFLYHTVPAYVVDFVRICLGKEPMMVKHYEKVRKFVDVIGEFSTKEWHFTNQNTQKLWSKLNRKDKELFQFSMENFNWDTYFFSYIRGARVYLLNDPLDTVPQGRVKHYCLFVAHYALLTVLFFIVYKIVALFYCFLF